jgi:2-methylcitrate dehydratase PrpD
MEAQPQAHSASCADAVQGTGKRAFEIMTTVAEQLASYACALRYEDLPREVVSQAKRLLVDTVACALGGAKSTPAAIARGIAGGMTSTRSLRRSW